MTLMPETEEQLSPRVRACAWSPGSLLFVGGTL